MTNYRKEFNLVLRTLAHILEDIISDPDKDIYYDEADDLFNVMKELYKIKKKIDGGLIKRSKINHYGVRYVIKYEDLDYRIIDGAMTLTAYMKVRGSQAIDRNLYVKLEYYPAIDSYNLDIEGK